MSETQTISCNDCVSACCRANTAIPLSKNEADQLLQAGTDLKAIPKRDWMGIKPGRNFNNEKRAFYLLQSDCGNLVNDPDTGASMCGDYENRPDACIEFTVGRVTCQAMRSHHIPEAVPVAIGVREY